MIVDLRTYTMVPGRLAAWLKLYEAEALPIQTRHLGAPIGVFTTEVGALNQVVLLWGYESQADRERRRQALEADPDWVAYRKNSAEAGNVQHQENKIIKSTSFSPLTFCRADPPLAEQAASPVSVGDKIVADYRKLFDLAGKYAVVLGAASGIGKASAEALAGLGAEVLCADHDRAGVEAVAAGIRASGGRAEPQVTDAASSAAVAALAEAAAQHFPRIDIAVTTPGLNIRKAILDYTDADLDRVIDLNIKGTVYFFQAFGRPMVAQGRGSLIACSSVRAVTIEPGLAVYGCTKAAISLLVKGFASEVGRAGVRVNAIAPSIVETALTAPFRQRPDIHRLYAAHTVFDRWSEPDEVAGAVAFLASDASSYVSGTTLFVDGGWTAVDGPPTGLTQLR